MAIHVIIIGCCLSMHVTHVRWRANVDRSDISICNEADVPDASFSAPRFTHFLYGRQRPTWGQTQPRSLSDLVVYIF